MELTEDQGADLLAWTSDTLAVLLGLNEIDRVMREVILKLLTQPFCENVDLTQLEETIAARVKDSQPASQWWLSAAHRKWRREKLRNFYRWTKANYRSSFRLHEESNGNPGSMWFFFHFQGYRKSDYISVPAGEYWKPEPLLRLAEIYRSLENNVKNTIFHDAQALRPVCIRRARKETLRGQKRYLGLVTVSLPPDIWIQCSDHKPVRTASEAQAFLESLCRGEKPDMLATLVLCKRLHELIDGRYVAFLSSKGGKDLWRTALVDLVRTFRSELGVLWRNKEGEGFLKEPFEFVYSLGLWGWDFLYFFPAVCYLPPELGDYRVHPLKGGFSCSFPRGLTTLEVQTFDRYCQYVYNTLLAESFASTKAELMGRGDALELALGSFYHLIPRFFSNANEEVDRIRRKVKRGHCEIADCQRCLDMASDIIYMGRMKSDEVRSLLPDRDSDAEQFEEIALADMLHRAWGVIGSALLKGGLHFKVRGDAGWKLERAEPGEIVLAYDSALDSQKVNGVIYSVALNLLDNAQKYGGRPYVTLATRRDQCVNLVFANGPIPPDASPQLGSESDRKHLGIPLVKKMVLRERGQFRQLEKNEFVAQYPSHPECMDQCTTFYEVSIPL